jgi:hypothetical protein
MQGLAHDSLHQGYTHLTPVSRIARVPREEERSSTKSTQRRKCHLLARSGV